MSESRQEPTSFAGWSARAAALIPDGRAVIGGQRVAAQSGATFPCISPIDGKKLADIARCDAADVDLAVASARAAFDDGRWSQRAPGERKRALIRLADLMMAHRDELALLETLDMGKGIRYSLSIDVPGAANCFRWFGEATDKIYDEIAPTARNTLALVTREPVGVVGAIVPWNYPMLMASWKLAPALAAGNSVVLKPSEKSPLTALRLAELALEAGIPPGVLNVLPGFGHEAGEALALHMDVDCIAFTGSTRVGKKIAEFAARSNLKRYWAELGGKSPNIVCADCPNLDEAVQAILFTMYFNQGESCNAPSRVLVEASIRDAFMERATQVAATWEPGNPLDPKSRMGAIVDDIQYRNVLRYIDLGNSEGARLAAGGSAAQPVAGGYYVRPTVFDGVTSTMTIAREEIFGPVVSVLSFDHIDEAVRMANDSAYGLAAGLWTSNLSRAHKVARALRAGTVHVNAYDEDDITVPFGGFKQSGNGRDKSLHAFDKYTELKTTWINLG